MRRVWNFFLLLLVFLLVCVLGYIAWGKFDKDELGRLSTLGATLCALAALWVSSHGHLRQDKYRDEDRKIAAQAALNEKGATEERLAKARAIVALVYATEIKMWLYRKELQDLLNTAVHAAREIDIQVPILRFLLSARESVEHISDPSNFPPDHIKNLEHVRERLGRELAMPAVRATPNIPNIWATQFRREDIDLLGTDALRFFLGMSTIWSNLSRIARQFPLADEVLDFTSQQNAADSEQYLKRLGQYIDEFKAIFEGFLAAAVEARSRLSEYPQASSSLTLPAIEPLLLRSQQASFSVADLLQWISLEKSMDLARKSKERVTAAVDAARQANENASEHMQALRKSAEETLDELERIPQMVTNEK